MFRQVKHEQKQQLAVSPELVEGLVQGFPNTITLINNLKRRVTIAVKLKQNPFCKICT